MKRLVPAALASAVLLGGCTSPAPEPAVDISAEADRALRQFDAAWAPRKKPLGESRDAQRELQKELFRFAPDAAADSERFCPDGKRLPDELALFAQINETYDKLMSGVLDELGAYERWSRRFGEARSRPDELTRPILRELVWSRARLDMLRTLLSTYGIDAEAQALRMQNACLVRIIRSRPAKDADAGLIDTQSRLERETARVLPSFGFAYHDAFSRIGSMPGGRP